MNPTSPYAESTGCRRVSAELDTDATRYYSLTRRLARAVREALLAMPPDRRLKFFSLKPFLKPDWPLRPKRNEYDEDDEAGFRDAHRGYLTMKEQYPEDVVELLVEAVERHAEPETVAAKWENKAHLPAFCAWLLGRTWIDAKHGPAFREAGFLRQPLGNRPQLNLFDTIS